MKRALVEGLSPVSDDSDDDSPVKRQQVTEPITPETTTEPLGAPVASPFAAVSPPSHAKSTSPTPAVSYELMPAAASVSFSVKVVVPKAAAGAVIGKGGDFINSLRTATGARIAMTESALDKPDLDRVATLTGQFMQIMNAFKPILEKLVAHQDPPAEVPGNCTVKLQLSNEQAGCLIGKGGAVINGIRTGAGVAVHIDSHKDAAVLSPMMTTDRFAALTGDSNRVMYAFQLIATQLANAASIVPPSGSHPALPPSLSTLPHTHSIPLGIPLSSSPLSAAAYSHHPDLQAMYAAQPVTHSFAVPDETVGRIIGKGGSVISDIRKMTGCKMTVAPKTGEERVRNVTLVGTSESVRIALALVNLKLSSVLPLESLMPTAIAAAMQPTPFGYPSYHPLASIGSPVMFNPYAATSPGGHAAMGTFKR